MSHIDLTEILLKTLIKNFTYSVNNYSDMKYKTHTGNIFSTYWYYPDRETC